MGKRKEESISKPGSNKRQRQEYTDEHSNESNEEEISQLSADSNLSSLSVSCLKSCSGEDIRKSFVPLVHIEINVWHVGFSGTNAKETRGNVCDEDFCMSWFLPYFFWVI